MDHEPTEASEAQPDLDAIAAELADVETALSRLDDGSYFTETNDMAGDARPADPTADHPTIDRAAEPS